MEVSSSSAIFHVEPRCRREPWCMLQASHKGTCSTFSSESYSEWCCNTHPSGVECNLLSGHAGLCLHTDSKMVALFSWDASITKDDHLSWRSRALLLGLKYLADMHLDE